MPRGGARVGAGAPLGNRNRVKKKAPEPSSQPRPRFETGRDFAMWCLNAPDDEAPMDQKIRAMQALLLLEKKQAKPAKPV